MSFKLLNSCLLKAKYVNEVQKLLESQPFDHINLLTGLRVLVRHRPGAQELGFLEGALQRQLDFGPSPHKIEDLRHLADLTGSLFRLGFRNPPWEAFWELSVQRFRALTPSAGFAEARYITLFLWALTKHNPGLLGQSEVVVQGLTHLAHWLPKLPPREISLSLYVMAKTGRPLYAAPVLTEYLRDLWPQFDHQGFANVAWAVGQLYADHPGLTHSVLVEGRQRLPSLKNPQHVANFLGALPKFSGLPHAIPRVLGEFDFNPGLPWKVSEIIQVLRTLAFSVHAYPEIRLDRLVQQICQTIRSCSSADFQDVLVQVGRPKEGGPLLKRLVPQLWDRLRTGQTFPNASLLLTTLVLHQCVDYPGFQLWEGLLEAPKDRATLWWVLASLSKGDSPMPWIPGQASHFRKFPSEGLDAKGSALCLWSTGVLFGDQWLPAPIASHLEILMDNLVQADPLPAIDATNAVWGLAQLRTYRPRFFQRVIGLCLPYQTVQVAACCQALDRLNLTSSLWIENLLKVLLPPVTSLEAQQVTAVLAILVNLGVNASGLLPSVVQKVQEIRSAGWTPYAPADLVSLMWAHTLCGLPVTSDIRDVMVRLRASSLPGESESQFALAARQLMGWPSARVSHLQSSHVHLRLSEELASLGVVHQNEFWVDSQFFVDIGMPAMKTAIEVQGDSHYVRDIMTDQKWLNGKSLAKARFIEALGWSLKSLDVKVLKRGLALPKLRKRQWLTQTLGLPAGA